MLVPDKTTYYLTALANHPRQEEFFDALMAAAEPNGLSSAGVLVLLREFLPDLPAEEVLEAMQESREQAMEN